MTMQPWGRRQTPKSLAWWVESDWRSRAVIMGSVLAVVATMVYAWVGPLPRTSTLTVLCLMPVVWVLELVRERRR